MAKMIQAGIDLLKKYEGLRLKAYPDPISGGAPYTIGYGATGPNIYEDTVWYLQQAEDDLRIRTDGLAKRILTLLQKFKINDNQLSAMVCFAYEEGMGNLIHVIHEVGLKGYPDKILEYDVASHKVVRGIENRRIAERALFLKVAS